LRGWASGDGHPDVWLRRSAAGAASKRRDSLAVSKSRRWAIESRPPAPSSVRARLRDVTHGTDTVHCENMEPPLDVGADGHPTEVLPAETRPAAPSSVDSRLPDVPDAAIATQREELQSSVPVACGDELLELRAAEARPSVPATVRSNLTGSPNASVCVEPKRLQLSATRRDRNLTKLGGTQDRPTAPRRDGEEPMRGPEIPSPTVVCRPEVAADGAVRASAMRVAGGDPCLAPLGASGAAGYRGELGLAAETRGLM
jgi:hypothetical protein